MAVTIRFFYQNIDGIPQDMDGKMKLQSIQHWLWQIDANVFAFMEAST